MSFERLDTVAGQEYFRGGASRRQLMGAICFSFCDAPKSSTPSWHTLGWDAGTAVWQDQLLIR